MFSAERPGDAWFVSSGFNLCMDFAVWLLELDGLQVPPFDHHPDGTGELRALGLDAARWRLWLWRLVQLDLDLAAPHYTPEDRLRLSKRMLPAPYPAEESSIWSGSPALQARLAYRWEDYGPLSMERGTPVRLHHSTPAHSPQHQRLWSELQPFHARLPHGLHIHLVRYPVRVEHLAPPATMILGLGVQLIAATDFRDSALHAAAGLAAANGA